MPDLDRNMSIGQFYDVLDAFNWNYMKEEPQEKGDVGGGKMEYYDTDPHMAPKRRHIDIKELAFRRYEDGFAALYFAFEKHAYHGTAKPERPA
jgi:hypothetical protein